MQDSFSRNINYLRISVTDRCNLRCVYCMPPEGVKHLPHEEILRIEEIEEFVKAVSSQGIRKIRLTGGEPLVRKGIEKIVSSLNEIDGIDDIAITTNGVLLEQKAKKLKEASLKRINISMDTLKPERYKKITRIGNLEDVKKGITAALNMELHPVKINSVIVRGINDDEVVDLAGLAAHYPLHVRFIELMPAGENDSLFVDGFFSAEEMKSCIEAEMGELYPEKRPEGAGPAKYYRIPGTPGTIGFISAMSDHFCESCNRLRLTSTGGLRPCLFSEKEVDIRGPLRNGASREEMQRLLARAIGMKPGGHGLNGIWSEKISNMSHIGG